MNNACESAGCGAPASLQCPTCVKFLLPPSYFCSQACFKANWSTHKLKHGPQQSKNKYNPFPDFDYTGRLRPLYPLTPRREVPAHIARPDYALTSIPVSENAKRGSTKIDILTADEQKRLRKVCKLAREILDIGAAAIKPGTTTDEIDRIVHDATIERDAYPSPLNYHSFPKSVCTSVNEVICHGIPDQYELQDGDICNIDVTAYFDGMHGDLNETLFVGTQISDEAKHLVQTSYECLALAIDTVRPGNLYRDVGNVIQKHASANNLSVVRSYCGHGINSLFHCAPSIPHYAKNKAVGVMKAGHSFTIEPMINQGTWRDETWPDNWTAVTADGKLSSQFEHTLLITEDGVDILTQNVGGIPHFKHQLDRINAKNVS